MTHAHLSATLTRFEAVIQRTKNRLVAIPTEHQRKLGLQRRRDNHLLYVSVRKRRTGRWNHHYVKLTYDNEFAIPSDVTHVRPGDPIEVKVHRIIPDVALPASGAAPPTGGALLRTLAARARPAWRTDGAERLDEYLSVEART